LLPDAVSHADAAFSAGRAALLVAAMTGTPQALFDATEDRLHQSYRSSAMPDAYDLVKRLRSVGHPAVISGAGPTVLVLARGDEEARATADQAPDGWDARVLTVDFTGAQHIS
jgi:homoserine kinase